IRDELMAWVSSLNQYKAGKGSDRQFWLAAWAGEPLSIDRKIQAGVPILVPHPFLGVIGGLPPELLTRFKDERGAADGFLDRLLFAFPSETPAVGETWLTISDQAVQAWSETVESLLRLNMERAEDGGSRPHFVRLTSEGRQEWKRFTDDLA